MMRLLTIAVTFMIAGPALAAWQAPGVTTQEMAAAQVAPATGITATVSAPYFTIADTDIEAAVAEQLKLQAVEEKAKVSMNAGSPKVIHSADHPLKLVLHALQIDPNSHRWQAQANILANGATETVKPVAGTYIPLKDVPVVTKQIDRNNIIEASDIAMKAVPETQLRKETVMDAKQLIGKSPRAGISPNRPIRITEIAAPTVVKRGDAVQMNYTTKYMTIRATGSALQDGATGDLIRIKNDKSGKAVSGRVTGAGSVEVNQSPES